MQPSKTVYIYNLGVIHLLSYIICKCYFASKNLCRLQLEKFQPMTKVEALSGKEWLTTQVHIVCIWKMQLLGSELETALHMCFNVHG